MANDSQLNMIQGVINRLAGNSFLLKGWTVTLVAALIGLASADSNRDFALIATFVVIVFGTLDAYYLALERRYRQLFVEESARTDANSWKLTVGGVERADIVSAVRSQSIWAIHGAGLVVSVVVAIAA
jgi:hypothetical protein